MTRKDWIELLLFPANFACIIVGAQWLGFGGGWHPVRTVPMMIGGVLFIAWGVTGAFQSGRALLRRYKSNS